ncbi:MAG: protein-L-isoaspartate O-methyltransferase [Magnetococcales bacterium]|nr:protein-L-isoaspartate O-methyltransferase [Magnetococcales bacterium]
MDFYSARVNMVKSQVAPNKVHEPEILDAMLAVPREKFVDASQQDLVYSDIPVVMGSDRRFLKPLQTAQLIQAVDVKKGERILVVGAGAGYEVALLEKMGAEVFALESNADLAKNAEARTGSDSVQWLVGDLELGWADQAPFDGIIFCGGISSIPAKLVGQLTQEGVLVAIVGKPAAPVMTLTRIKGVSGGGHPEFLLETVAPLLPGMAAVKRFEL